MTGPVVFDAYGTLFDVDAAARRAAAEPGREGLAAVWPQLARDWRDRQLQYTWLRSIAGAHADFETVTGEALDWALEAAGLAGDAALRARLMALYRELDAYPEVPAMLAALKAAGRPAAILSNGAPEMLAATVRAAGLEGAFDAVLSVEAVGVYKPARAVYDLVAGRFGCAPEDVLFVSSNGWDAGCAAGYGFRTVWANRARRAGRPAALAAGPRAARSRRGAGGGGRSGREALHHHGRAVARLPRRGRGAAGAVPAGADAQRARLRADRSRRSAGRARVIRLDLRGRGASEHDPAYLNYNILTRERRTCSSCSTTSGSSAR